MAKKKSSRIKKHPDGLVQTDYVEPGSEDHAMAVLGLEPAEKADPMQMTDKKGRAWKLADTTMYGPQVTERYLREVLRQKISELDAPQPEIQSEDPLAPGYAPPLYVPPELNPYTGEWHYPDWYTKGRKTG